MQACNALSMPAFPHAPHKAFLNAEIRQCKNKQADNGAGSKACIAGIVSRKGGVGKSALARMMAREFTAGGLRAKTAELDTRRQTRADWAGRRAESGISPEVRAQSFASVGTSLGEAQHPDALVPDGKPNASGRTAEIAGASDFAVMPTGQTVDDHHPGALLAHSLRRKGVARERCDPQPPDRPHRLLPPLPEGTDPAASRLREGKWRAMELSFR